MMTKSVYWFTQNLPDVPENDDWLSRGEREIVSAMRFPKRRNDWRLGRWTAKRAVCAYQMKEDFLLPSLEIRAAFDGAPEAFWNDGSENVSISISHSKDRSLCVVGPRDFAVGCDLEWIEPREESLIRDYFTPEEITLSKKVPQPERDIVSNLIWSAKETTLKILREGLRRDTHSISIRPDLLERKGAWNTWEGQCLESSRVFSGWWCCRDGFVYTLASDHFTAPPGEIPRT
jgi:4'-phosphopantetheinyl transferase